MSKLSPITQEAWDAFNTVCERVGVFEDYGDALAAYTKVLIDRLLPHLEEPDSGGCNYMQCDIELYTAHQRKRKEFLNVIQELEDR